MREPDHYAVLGVERNASTETIRHAYRALARRLHPDVCDDPDAAERFKLVTSAYNVLSDPDRRREYELDLLDELAEAGGAAAQDVPAGPQPGEDTFMNLEITLREAVLGAQRQARIGGVVSCCACGGLGVLPSEERCSACRGTGRVNGEQEVTVTVPAGSQTGDTVRIEGLGEAGWKGGRNGDLFIELTVADDEVFHRDGDDLRGELQLTICDATLGVGLTIETWQGPLKITVPAGTQPGSVLELPGHGVPRRCEDGAETGERGALLLTVRVAVPTDLNAPQRQALEWFRDMRPEDESGMRTASGELQESRQPRDIEREER